MLKNENEEGIRPTEGYTATCRSKDRQVGSVEIRWTTTGNSAQKNGDHQQEKTMADMMKGIDYKAILSPICWSAKRLLMDIHGNLTLQSPETIIVPHQII